MKLTGLSILILSRNIGLKKPRKSLEIIIIYDIISNCVGINILRMRGRMDEVKIVKKGNYMF